MSSPPWPSTRCSSAGPNPLPPAGEHTARTPITGGQIGWVPASGSVGDAVTRATEAFASWRTVPAPRRAEVVRHLGLLLRANKSALARLVQLEVGKIESEALGEVQEMIDICDFAVGLGASSTGSTSPAERPGHRLAEQWHPLGPTAVITAFNFPVAVWAWNAALAIVCGNPVLWKPSELTPLTAAATAALFDRAAKAAGAPPHLNQVVHGGADVGARLVAHEGVSLVSATGSTAMGRRVAPSSPAASAAASSSSAATTRPSSRRRPILRSPYERSRSRPPGPPASDARRCAG